jgi:phosphotransferase system  glucose/maltose/N-acetylglucosamine-specific IIC component
MRVCMCVYVYWHVCVCMLACVYVYWHVCVCMLACVCMCVCSYGHLRGHYLFGPGVIVFICIFNVPRKDIARVEKRA